ncbi:GDSL family lipase [Rhizoctonia solani AG-1 IB]|uniref:GDSL family lipase n=1 Tax=Thanatephorus cucumeris (strain AG1-IB / isolate 7/3/14) TaxID=1108050 RepID=M5BT64_THACB|nr:GDSL family lipase [Rhizoctonia solani AG-1 IB]
MLHYSLLVVALATSVSGFASKPGYTRGALADGWNCSLKLAFKPKCGKFSSATYVNANSGIDLKKIKTAIVPFGDSWTAMNDSTGAYPPPPPVFLGTYSMAGGRASNGPTWTEYIANDTSSEVHPYAIGGAVTDLTLWPTAIARKININSFTNQTKIFLSQNNTWDPSTTLYTIFFGINDYTYSKTDGFDILLKAAEVVRNQTELLIAAGAKNILTAGLYHNQTGSGPYKQALYDNLKSLRAQHPKINIAFADFFPLWNAINSSESNYGEAFGYTNLTKCLTVDSSIVGACESPQTHLYWQSGHPSTCTHRLMADYIETVLDTCKS